MASLVAFNEHECADTSHVSIEIADPVFDLSIDEVIQSVDGDKINFIVRVSNNGTVLAHHPEVKIRFDESFEIIFRFNLLESVPVKEPASRRAVGVAARLLARLPLSDSNLTGAKRADFLSSTESGSSESESDSEGGGESKFAIN